MAFVMCDDHNESIEVDDLDPAGARKALFLEEHAANTESEKELSKFGRVHRECNIRILAD